MRDIPILFSEPMVRAIPAGGKVTPRGPLFSSNVCPAQGELDMQKWTQSVVVVAALTGALSVKAQPAEALPCAAQGMFAGLATKGYERGDSLDQVNAVAIDLLTQMKVPKAEHKHILGIDYAYYHHPELRSGGSDAASERWQALCEKIANRK